MSRADPKPPIPLDPNPFRESSEGKGEKESGMVEE
jgi:hypothetical protein